MDKIKQYGIVYTPENIARNMVEKTLLQYLSYEKIASNIDELLDDYSKNGKLDVLYNKLESLRIIEPACGDGAVLLPLCELLFDIHTKYIEYTCDNDKESHYWQVFNSIFGVDIDKEAVDRCKLKLMYLFQIYLPGITLRDFDAKIIVGDSIISDTGVNSIGFDWKNEFSDVFIENGGFDICITNPPYVRQELFKEIKPYLQENYVTYRGTNTLYVYFFEKGLDIIKENGILTYLCNNGWLRSRFGQKLRKLVLNYYIEFCVDYKDKQLFKNIKSNSMIICIRKRNESNPYMLIDNNYYLDQSYLSSDEFNFIKQDVYEVYNKIKNNNCMLCDIPGLIHHLGTKSGCNNVYIIGEDLAKEMISECPSCADVVKPCIRGADIRKGFLKYNHEYIIFAYNGVDISMYPPVEKYLYEHYDELAPQKPGSKHGRSNYNNREWYELQSNIGNRELYAQNKLLYPVIVEKFCCIYDDNGYYPIDSVGVIVCESDELTYLIYAILNSTLIQFIIRFITPGISSSFECRKVFMDKIPVAIPFDDEIKCKIEKISHEMIFGDYVYEHEIIALQKQLDSAVYELYELSSEEINIIENFIQDM